MTLLPIIGIILLIWKIVSWAGTKASKAQATSSSQDPWLGADTKLPKRKKRKKSYQPWAELISFILVPVITFFISAQKACPGAIQAREADPTGFWFDGGDRFMIGQGWSTALIAVLLSVLGYLLFLYTRSPRR